MAIKFNTTNGSITLDAADGTGNVDLSIPREGIQAIDANLAKYNDSTANFTGTLQNAGANVVVDTDIGSTVQAFDSTILKDADIGSTVQAFDSTILNDADIGSTVQAFDSTILKDSDIGVNVQAFDSTILKDADIGVNVQAFDSTILKDADIGVNVQAFDSTILKDADIGVNVQAYDPDTAKLDVLQTFSAKQIFTGDASNAAIEIKNAVEDGTVQASSASGTINYDILSQSVLYYSSNSNGNWTINIRGDSNTTLSSLMDVGDSISFVFLATQGGTAYYNSAFQVDGVTITPKWQGGSAPSEGNASGIDSYGYSVIKTGSSSFVVLASQTQFA